MKKFGVLLLTVLGLSLSCVFEAGLTNENNSSLEHVVSNRVISPYPRLKALAPVFDKGKHSFQSLSILEDGRVFAVGYDGEKAGQIEISTDEGKTWTSKELSKSFAMPDSIFFADNEDGWVSGTGDIFRTTNGGKSWDKTPIGGYLRFSDFSFYGTDVGYLMGKHSIEKELATQIWVTTDGGRSWKKCYQNKELTTPFSILALSETIAFAVLDETTIIKTSDTGKSWTSLDSSAFRAKELAKDGNSRLWVVGPKGTFFFTNDAGITWERPKGFPEDLKAADWNSIDFSNNTFGFAVGARGSLAFTDDGGNSWKRIETNISEDFYRVYTNGSYGLLVGSQNLFKVEF